MSEPDFKIVVCPSCNTGIEGKLLKESKGICIDCGNTDWSEEARKIPKDNRKENCVKCGKLLDLGENSVTGFRAYGVYSLQSISTRAFRKYRDKEKKGWLYFCKAHGDCAKPGLADKIIDGRYFWFPVSMGAVYLGTGVLDVLYAALEGRPDLISQYFFESIKDPYIAAWSIALGIGMTLYERKMRKFDAMRPTRQRRRRHSESF